MTLQRFLGSHVNVFVRDIVCIANEPRHEKTCLRSLRSGKTQTGLRSHRNYVEAWNFGYRNWRYYTIHAANNKGADQAARMRRVICAFVVRIWHKQVFSWRGSYNKIVKCDRQQPWKFRQTVIWSYWNIQHEETSPVYMTGARIWARNSAKLFPSTMCLISL